MVLFLKSTKQINKNQIKLVRPTEVHLSKLVAFQEAHEMTRDRHWESNKIVASDQNIC
jgi:hypothetical protein